MSYKVSARFAYLFFTVWFLLGVGIGLSYHEAEAPGIYYNGTYAACRVIAQNVMYMPDWMALPACEKFSAGAQLNELQKMAYWNRAEE